MKNIVNSYVKKFTEEHRKTRKAVALLLALAMVVATGVSWQLHATGIALTNETYCGLEEHTHSADCYEEVLTCGLEESEGHTHTEDCYKTETVLVCGKEESEGHTHTEDCYDADGSLICGQEESEGHTHSDACYKTETTLVCGKEESEGHTHSDACYEEQLVCGLEEHTHTVDCLTDVTADVETAADWEATLPELTGDWAADLVAVAQSQLGCGLEEHTHTVDCLTDVTADVETAADWEATLPELTGDWAADLVAVAQSQLGYAESTANFTLADDGTTRQGYTRYGAWYGNAYGAWDAMFVSFCLSYAGIPEESVPQAAGAYAWTAALSGFDCYTTDGDYTPAAGDIAFFDADGDGVADGVGIVSNVSGANMTVVQGDSGDQVAQKVYAISEATAFVDMTAAAEAAGTAEAEEADAEAEEADEAEAEAEAETYTASADGVTVTVTAPVGALPENVELIVTLLDEDSDAYTEAAEAVGYDAEDEDTGMAAMDISFYDGDGLEVEPTAPVSVSIDASALLPEEADAGTIEVQHLTETGSGVEATLVADAGNGVDTDAATAEFEVESFSTFTLTWSNGDGMSGPGDNNNASVTATATSYFSGTSTVIGDSTETLSLSSGTAVALTEDNYVLKIDGYTLVSATISVNNGTAVTATSITVSMSTSGQGKNQKTTYTVSYVDSNGATQTAYNNTSEPSITISLYYTKNNPSVEISVSGSSDAYTLTATPSDFSGDPSYSWAITDGSANATITTNDDGTATVTWSKDASEGDTVTVTVTATYGDETATNTYTLKYGYELLIVYVTCNGESAAEGATVTITDASEATQTGTTDENGCVSFWVSDATTYTITASYAVSTSKNLTGSETIIVNGVTTETIELTSDASKTTSVLSSSTNFGHIDIKTTGAESEGSEGYTLDSITSVVIKNSSGTTLYTSSSVTEDDSNGEWRISFSSNNVSIYTTYSITIEYVVIDSGGTEHKYTATITSDSTYADGATYSTDGDGAYKLYNYLYGTTYSSNAELKMDGITEVDIGGMSVFLVAAIVCNGSTVSYNSVSKTDGLDFVLDLGTLLKYSANWDFEVVKTFENSGMTDSQFTFVLASAEVTDEDNVTNSVWTIDSTLQTQTNSEANAGSSGNSTDTISFTQINYSSDDVDTYYYIVYEQNGGTTVDGIAYSSAVYGVVVTVTTTETTSTSGTKTVTTAATATYYKLAESENGTGYVISGDAINTWTWSSSGSTLISLPFTNSYASSTDFTIVKVDADNTSTTLSGAKFTLTSSDGSTYYTADGTAETSEVTLTTDSDGKISVTGISNGAYTLTETAAPDGYNLLTGTVTITVSGGTVTAYYNGENILTTDSDGNYIITVENEAGYVLPSTGGSGTWLYTLTGTVLCCGAALVLWKRRVTD